MTDEARRMADTLGMKSMGPNGQVNVGTAAMTTMRMGN